MKSEKTVRIELRNPVLRRIQKNMRDIIRLATKNEIKRLQDEEVELIKRPHLTPEEEKREYELSFKSNKLRDSLSDSIIQCSMGAACDSHQKGKKEGFNPRDRRTDLDMVWVPEDRKWYCTECYENYWK